MSLWSWLGKVFSNVKQKWAKSAVAIGELIFPLFDAKTGIIAGIEEALLPKAGAAIVAIEQKAITGLIATGLAIEGLPDNPTEDDMKSFEEKVVGAFGKLDDKSKFKTTLIAQIYGIIHKTLSEDGGHPKFADCVKMVEDAWLDYQADKAAEAEAQAGTETGA